MKIILIVIAVFNGRPYVETPMYAVEYKTETACVDAANTFASQGAGFYKKAMCVPKVQSIPRD